MNSHEQNTQMGMGSGLTRYRSAPSTYLASLLSTPGSNGGLGVDDFVELFNTRASSPETQVIFSRFMNDIQDTCPSTGMALPLQNPAKSEAEEVQPPLRQQLRRQSSNDYSSASQMMHANHNMERPATATSSHIRHSSSPAGLFANINIDNEFKMGGGLRSYGGGNSTNAEASSSPAIRLISRMDYSRHTSGMMDPIIEIGSKGMGENAADDAQFDEDIDYITGLPVNSWDDSALVSDHYINGVADNVNKTFYNANAPDDQKNEACNRSKTPLSHHLSLPKSSAELSAMEKLLQDSVPCKIRAKRGCATHPRSIAERVRRTKISERMRKLQELVPNMEKQTNTSDMLDLAVDYIKELQRQVKTLSDNQANCGCSA